MAPIVKNSFKVWIDGRATFETSEKAEALLRFIAEYAPVKSTWCGTAEPFRTPFSLTNLGPAVHMLVNDAKQRLTPDTPSGDVFLVSERKKRSTYHIEWRRGPHTPFGKSSCSVDEAHLEDPKHLNIWLDFCLPLLELLDAWYARFFLDEEFKYKNTIRWQTPPKPGFPEGVARESVVPGAWIHRDGLPGIYWGNYFGPFYVDWFGREKFETLTCIEKRELPTGGIFFTTAPTPFDWDKPEALETCRSVIDHLGADAFFDVQDLRAKLAAIGEPFADNFDPRTLIPAVQVPRLPFASEMEERKRSREEKIGEARRYFETHGFSLVNVEGDTLLFRDTKGGVTKVDIGAASKAEHWPKL